MKLLLAILLLLSTASTAQVYQLRKIAVGTSLNDTVYIKIGTDSLFGKVGNDYVYRSTQDAIYFTSSSNITGTPIPTNNNQLTNGSGYLVASDTAAALSKYLRINVAAATYQPIGSYATANAWVDYSATSTIVGWSSFTTKSIRYQVGYKRVHLVVVLDGTSNAATLTFTLPVALGASAIAGATFLNFGTNNGVNATKAASITGSTVTVGNSPVLTSTAWTTSGTKTIVINMVYETD